MSARQARDTRHTFSTGEVSFAALESFKDKLDAFLLSVGPDFAAMQPDPVGELAYLRETITEHVRGQFSEAVEAAGEFFEADPLAIRKVA